MSLVQRLVTSIVPRTWAQSIEVESRTWKARCVGCERERSIWEMGGIRWKAAGNPRRLLACPRCGGSTLHLIHKSG